MQINLTLLLQIVIALLGAYFLAFWVSLIIWTFRDVRARSRDIFAQLLATLMVVVFNVAGLVLYYILRPKTTLAEEYERELAEKALLQDVVERRACPSCNQTIEADFQLCPNCHTKLKKPCPQCGRLLHMRWNVCPYCATPVAAPPAPVPIALPEEIAER